MGPNLLTFHARSWLLAKLAMIWPPRAAVYSFLAISRIPIYKCLGKDASFAARHQKKSMNKSTRFNRLWGLFVFGNFARSEIELTYQ